MSDASQDRVYTLGVDGNKAGLRLDRFLAEAIDALSRSRIKALLLDGRAQVGGHSVRDPSYRIKQGELVCLTVPPARPADPEALAMVLDIRFEDDALLVLDKPAGLVVHPGAGNRDGTLVNALLAHCAGGLSGIGGVERPGIVHRLDKDTSGLMVVAKTDDAHKSLSRQFAEREVQRAYRAIVWGVPVPAQGEIEGNIGRHPKARRKMAVVARGGKVALTRYCVRERVGTLASLVECRLATGRTHQIRVHMAHIGHAIVGDPLYGRTRPPGAVPDAPVCRALKGYNNQALHAFLIGFVHPTTDETLFFESENSQYINELKEILRKF